MSEPAQKRRIASIELLRIAAMLMVVTLHYISKTGALALPGDEMTPVRYMGGLIESFCIVAVNVYVLISGYFLSAVPFKVSRGVRLLAQVLFYTLLIPLVLKAAGLEIYGQDVWKAAAYFLPVSTEHYWFVSAYGGKTAGEGAADRSAAAFILHLLFKEHFAGAAGHGQDGI